MAACVVTPAPPNLVARVITTYLTAATISCIQFVLVAGSHKALYPIPRPKHTSMDLALVRHLEPTAGSVVMYYAGTAHGVWGWTGKTERRAVMSKAFTRLHPDRSKL